VVSWNTTKDGASHYSYVVLPPGYCGVSFIVYEIYSYPCGTIGICPMKYSKPCQAYNPPPMNLTPAIDGYVNPHLIYTHDHNPNK